MNDGTRGMWAVVSLKDGMVFEGTIEDERPYGVYLHIGGDDNRLSLFPWHRVDRIVYKD